MTQHGYVPDESTQRKMAELARHMRETRASDPELYEAFVNGMRVVLAAISESCDLIDRTFSADS